MLGRTERSAPILIEDVRHHKFFAQLNAFFQTLDASDDKTGLLRRGEYIECRLRSQLPQS
jgi:hypothetical protein